MTYEYIYLVAADNYDTVPLADLNTAGASGWRAVGTVSRPGLPDRVLMVREKVTPPAKKATR